MRLSVLELVVAWLVALCCAGLAVSALISYGMGPRRLTFALLVVTFAYKLVARSLAAIMVAVVVAVFVTLFGVLMTANGEVSSGLTVGLNGAVVAGLLGNVVLRELGWWS